MRKLCSTILIFFLIASNLVFANQAQAAKPKDDITGITLEKEMRDMIALGVMQGYKEGVYRPKENVSRGQFATFIARALQLPKGSGSFPDVPKSSSLADGIYKAYKAGIVNGKTNGTFGIDDPITRQQIAMMIDNALEYLNIDRVQAPVTFTDANKFTSSHFKLAASHSIHYKIIQGFPDNTFRPSNYATRDQAAAFISRLLKVVSDNQPELAYQVAKISNGELVYENKRYNSFSAAAAAAKSSNKVVVQGKKVLKMNDGVVYAKPSPGKSTTNIYEANLSEKNTITYVTANAEMKYLDADEKKIKVQIADSIGYVKPSEVWLTPKELQQGRSYYANNSGVLTHYVFNSATGKYENYVYGVAPSFMKSGQKYYSWNGHDFESANGKTVGTAYQYFNMLSVRTKTNYTAEELNAFVAAKKPASPLKNLGKAFKDAEKKYNVNALFLLATAINESGWGLSSIAQAKNNLFGIRAVDSDPEKAADEFTSFEKCIDYMAGTFIGKGYAIPSDWRYNGAVVGNKTIGFNVRYASDPYWGQKIAGHMYNADNYLGKKDTKNSYQIAGTTTTNVRVRPEPNTRKTEHYQYRNNKTNYPLVIISETAKQADGYTWYQVIPDHNAKAQAFVRSDLLESLPIAK